MASWLEKHWPLLALAGVATVGVIVYAKKAPAAAQALPSGGGTAPNGLAAGQSTQVNLQPGTTVIAPVVNSQVVLALPSGATWQSVAEGSAAVSLTGNTSWSFYATETVVLTAVWTDASNMTQVTTINVNPTPS